MQRIPPSWFTRLRAGWRFGLTAFLGSLGLVGTAVTIMSASGRSVSIPVGGGLVCLCGALSIGVAYARGRGKLLPDSFVEELGREPDYIASFCTAESLEEANRLTKPYYGAAYVASDRAEQWRLKNPYGFVELRNNEGALCAAFGVVALDQGFMDQFIAGNVTDDMIDSRAVLSFEDSKQANQLYISGVVVRKPQTAMGSKRARVMLWCMLVYLQRLYGLRRDRRLYALAVTKESDRLLSNLGFGLVSEGSVRKDGFNLYSCQFNRAFWEYLVHHVGDFSGMCSLELDYKRG